MAAIGFPLTGQVTSWGSGTDFVAKLITHNSAKSFTLNATGKQNDASILTSNFAAFVKSTKTVTGTIVCELATALDGYNGSVSGTGYFANLNAWEIAISRTLAEITPFGQSWAKFTPGMVSWNGSYSGFLDDTTAPDAPNLASDPASATFTVISGGTGKQLVGSIIRSGSAIVTNRQAVSTVSMNFQGTGALTTTGSSTAALWPTDASGTALSAVESKTLVLQTVTGLTISGVAYWNSIKITNRVGENVRVEIGFTYSDTVTGLSV